MQHNILKLILSSPRSVFTTQSLSMLSGINNGQALTQALHYYTKRGELLNPHRGIYCKKEYREEEMACAIIPPSYISMEYVLQRAGVTFQYDSTITSISSRTREYEIDGKRYSFRQINPLIWMNMSGISQIDNVAIACPERAFLDMLYLSCGQCYFDNLRPISKKMVAELLPCYRSNALEQRANELLKRK